MKKKKKKKQTVCSLKIELLLSENKLKYTIALQKKKLEEVFSSSNAQTSTKHYTDHEESGKYITIKKN